VAGIVAAFVGGRTAAAEPGFQSRVARIDAATAARMSSWRPGCPVPIARLRIVTLSYWGFDRRVHSGRLVVSRSSVAPIARALHALFDARFPIRRMRTVDAYGGSDDRSMAADNTSAFNCRRVTGSRSWSEHAYGRAIDINPLENPEILHGRVLPPAGAAYVNRRRRARGMIHTGDAVVRAFGSVGWRWGGDWRSPKDYQHFSATGR